MGEAIISALKSKGKQVIIYDIDKGKLNKAVRKYRVNRAGDIGDLVRGAKTILIAVKPQDIDQVLLNIKQALGLRKVLVISIAAGIPISYIEKKIGKGIPVVRAMPNLAARIKKSISALSTGRSAVLSHLKTAKTIFSSIGECVVLREKDIDLVTAVSGSGPGYIYYFLSCIQSASERLGFSKDMSRRLVLETAKGAIELISESKDGFADWAKRVASARGTTEAGLACLKERGFERIIYQAVSSAHKRAKELNRGN